MARAVGKKTGVSADVTGRYLTLRSIPMPADTIADDYISAGWLLSEMDKAGGRYAYSFAANKVVTVGIDAMSFKKPVHIGDLVSFYTEIVRVGRSSIHLKIDSYARRRKDDKEEKVTEGLFSFVAIDENGRPREVTTPRAASFKAAGNGRAARIVPATSLPPIEKTEENLRLRAIPMPRDTNHIGDVFGGWVLANMDLACSKTAQPYSHHYAVTVGIESMSFHRPVLVGDDVSFYTAIQKIGKTSIAVRVETWACRRQNPAAEEKVTEGTFTYVSVDRNKIPFPARSETFRRKSS